MRESPSKCSSSVFFRQDISASNTTRQSHLNHREHVQQITAFFLWAALLQRQVNHTEPQADEEDWSDPKTQTRGALILICVKSACSASCHTQRALWVNTKSRYLWKLGVLILQGQLVGVEDYEVYIKKNIFNYFMGDMVVQWLAL